MSKQTYQTEIGSYGDDIRLSINLEVKGGVDKEDYETLRQAFQTIEDLTYKYVELAASKIDLDKLPA